MNKQTLKTIYEDARPLEDVLQDVCNYINLSCIAVNCNGNYDTECIKCPLESIKNILENYYYDRLK